jgi:ketosteroid isomerase-like protein
MSAEDNKNVVRRFWQAFAAGDLEEVGQLLTDDFTFWLAPTSIASGTYPKEKWLQLMSDVLSDLAGPMTLKAGHITAEDDRVSITMEGNLPFKNGKVYSGQYHNLFFLRDGKISSMKEYADTYHLGEIFGFPGATDAAESSLQFAARSA